ncbi:MAG: T9SS type A sorting domain-containing protein [Bacteroidetes bacterium]|nr:T9SS type A sorting domain-containing protein [Bacteroidota bacterium]
MKKLIYIFVLLICFGKTKSQGIASITLINGSFITTIDTVYLKIVAGFASAGGTTGNNYSFIGSVISNTINGCTGGLSSYTAIEENFKINPLVQGTYKFKVTLNEYDNFIYPGCNILKSHNVDSISINIVTYTGIKENLKSINDVIIYPIPLSDKLKLDFAIEPFDTKLNIINNLGQVVYSLNSLSKNEQIDLSFLASGLYYLKLSNQDAQKTSKIFKH